MFMKTVSIRRAKSELSRLLEHVSSGKISLKEAKSKLSQFLEDLSAGEEILITRDGIPIARLEPLD